MGRRRSNVSGLDEKERLDFHWAYRLNDFRNSEIKIERALITMSVCPLTR